MESAKRIMLPILVDMLLMDAQNSLQMEKKALMELLLVLLVAATGTSIEEKLKLKWFVNTFLQMLENIQNYI